MTAVDTPTHSSDLSGPPNSGEFIVGYVPGVMPGKWFVRWRERGLHPALTDVLVPAANWRAVLHDDAVTACFVRLGWAPGDPSLEEVRVTHNAVHLYDELQVAVLSTDDVLTVLDSLTLAQLTEESRPQPHADIDDAAMSVELAAAGAGPVVLPMSVARLHARKDVTFLPLTDAPSVPVVLVWPRGLDEEDEDTVQRFVGIVRGRKPSSGRDAPRGAGLKPGGTGERGARAGSRTGGSAGNRGVARPGRGRPRSSRGGGAGRKRA